MNNMPALHWLQLLSPIHSKVVSVCMLVCALADRFTVCVGACTVSCVWVQGYSDTLRWAAGDKFYIRHWHLTNLPLTAELGVSPPHSASCMASLYCFVSVFCPFLCNVKYAFLGSATPSSPNWELEKKREKTISWWQIRMWRWSASSTFEACSLRFYLFTYKTKCHNKGHHKEGGVRYNNQWDNTINA